MSENNTKKSKKENHNQNIILDYPKADVSFSVFKTGNDFDVVIQFLAAPAETKAKKGKTQENSLLKDFPFFKAGPSEIVKSAKIWYVGVGSTDELTVDTLGEAVLSVANFAAQSFKKVTLAYDDEIIENIGISEVVKLSIFGFAAASYPVDLLKSKPASQKIQIKKVFIKANSKNQKIVEDAIKKSEKVFRHVNAMRQLQSLPSNYANPESIEKRARKMAKEFGLKIKVFQMKDLEKMGAGGIVAVGKGSVIGPRMIVLEYIPKTKKGKTLGLIGKGVTFDTGGISIKPSSEMHEMKYDMSGAAAVLHSIAAIAELKLPTHVVAAIGLAENMPDGAAIKPGDVYTAYNNKTIEVQNTDAEGRLILGDLLSYVGENYKPALMVNLATLTGACLVALGRFYAGLFTENEDVKNTLLEASKESLEPVWPMPMGPLYKKMLKSNIADYNNIGERWGGASSAAGFLSVFVDKKIPWAHIDIAGIAYMTKGFGVYPTVATGYGVRLLVELARQFK